MNIKVLFNNEAIDDKFSAGWGFSCLVGNSVLFDTGENGEYLFHNIKIMGVDISAIDKVIISHDHWDHTGGLWEILSKRENLTVYSCPGFSSEFKDRVKSLGAELVELDGFTEIKDNIFVSGEIESLYHGKDMPEQALCIRTDKGITVITGCAHPGIINMAERAKVNFSKEKIYSILGGFHLKDKSKDETEAIAERFRELGVERVGPTHCSGKEAEDIFKKQYGSKFIAVKTGVSFEV